MKFRRLLCQTCNGKGMVYRPILDAATNTFRKGKRLCPACDGEGIE